MEPDPSSSPYYVAGMRFSQKEVKTAKQTPSTNTKGKQTSTESDGRKLAEDDFRKLQNEPGAESKVTHSLASNIHDAMLGQLPGPEEYMIARSPVYLEYEDSAYKPSSSKKDHLDPRSHQTRTVTPEKLLPPLSNSKNSPQKHTSLSKLPKLEDIGEATLSLLRTSISSKTLSQKSLDVIDMGDDSRKVAHSAAIHAITPQAYAIIQKAISSQGEIGPSHKPSQSRDIGKTETNPSKSSTPNIMSQRQSSTPREIAVKLKGSVPDLGKNSPRLVSKRGNEANSHSSTTSEFPSVESEISYDTEFCNRFEEIQLDELNSPTPRLDHNRQAMVDIIMEKFGVIFNQNWSPNVAQRAGESSQDRPSKGGKGKTEKSKPLASGDVRGKRKRSCDGNQSGEDGDGSETAHAKNSRYGGPGFACQFRKNDPIKYNL